jgi:hypothetical protein
MNVFGLDGNFSTQADLNYFKSPFIEEKIGVSALDKNAIIFEWDTRTLVVCGGTQVSYSVIVKPAILTV